MTPFISIIVPVRFRPDLTRVCFDNLFRYTDIPFELIIVQDGIEPGMTEEIDTTENYLTFDSSWRGKCVKRITHETAKGYPAAINAGYRIISDKATHVVFLNSDTVPTPGWLTELLKAFEQDPAIGLVAPTYGETGGVQNIDFNKKGVDYTWVDEVKGVCMMFRRDVADAIVADNIAKGVRGAGILNEMYGLGGGDDNEICMINKLLGYKAIVARKSFIYHYNSASFRELFDNDAAYSRKYAGNVFSMFKEKFKAELGHKPRIFIAIPTLDGNVNAELAMRLTEWSHDPELSVAFKYYQGLAPLDNSRNQAVKEFLEEYYDYFCTIDSDIIPPPNCLRELVAADKDVIAPICFNLKQGDDGLFYPMPIAFRINEHGEYKVHHGSGIEETDIVTGGMHLVKRSVMAKLDRPYYFTYHANGTVIYSEDFIFSQQAKDLGYKLFTHFGIITKHVKPMDLKNLNDVLVKISK